MCIGTNLSTGIEAYTLQRSFYCNCDSKTEVTREKCGTVWTSGMQYYAPIIIGCLAVAMQ